MLSYSLYIILLISFFCIGMSYNFITNQRKQLYNVLERNNNQNYNREEVNKHFILLSKEDKNTICYSIIDPVINYNKKIADIHNFVNKVANDIVNHVMNIVKNGEDIEYETYDVKRYLFSNIIRLHDYDKYHDKKEVYEYICISLEHKLKQLFPDSKVIKKYKEQTTRYLVDFKCKFIIRWH